MKQSPYFAFSWPSRPNSSVCSIAIFKYPSRHASTPRYSIPEFSFTRTGRPRTDFKKSEGERFLAPSVYDDEVATYHTFVRKLHDRLPCIDAFPEGVLPWQIESLTASVSAASGAAGVSTWSDIFEFCGFLCGELLHDTIAPTGMWKFDQNCHKDLIDGNGHQLIVASKHTHAYV